MCVCARVLAGLQTIEHFRRSDRTDNVDKLGQDWSDVTGWRDTGQIYQMEERWPDEGEEAWQCSSDHVSVKLFFFFVCLFDF